MKIKRLATIFSVALVVSGLAVAPGPAPAVLAGNSVSYVLFATDTYIQLADGTILYNYGFVGGRSTDPVIYQNSIVAPPKAPKTFVPGGLVDGTPVVAPAVGTGGACQGLTWGAAANTPTCVAQLAGNAQFPAPLIRAAKGDAVEIRLVNLGVTNKTAPNDPHSIHLHGLDVNAANDGVPETSVGAIPANMAVPGAGNVIYYYFTPTHTGTYMYHCHQEADIHVQMGMFGALVVYDPADEAYTSWLSTGTPTGGGTLMGWSWTKETILLLSEFDVRQHTSEQNALGGAAAFNPVDYHPQYWSINGLSFPNTIHVAPPVVPVLPAGKSWFNDIWLKAHPGYDPLIVGSVNGVTNGLGVADKVLLRTINMGFETQPMHMHGFHGKIIGSDQRGWFWANDATNPAFATGSGLEKNTLTIGSGETYEWLLDFGAWANNATSTYQVGTQTRYFDGTAACRAALSCGGVGQPTCPALNTPVGNTAWNFTTNTGCPAILDPAAVPPASYVGGPTVGPIYSPTNPEPAPGSVPGQLLRLAGFSAFNGQLFPFHNHDDYKATNNGVYPGGMFTMIATLP